MKAQWRFGMVLAWSRLTAVFLVDVAILLITSRFPESWPVVRRFWAGVGLAAVVTVLALVTHRGRTATASLAALVRPGPALGAGCTEPIGHQHRFGQHRVGVREYRDHLISILAVDGVLRLSSVAEGLRQFDLEFDGIDVVSVGNRGGGCRTWLVLRMDPERNVAAVSVRDSVASTLVAATERLARHLDGTDCSAKPVAAADFTDIDETVLAGLQPTVRRSGQLRGVATSFWLTPANISTDTIDQLWAVDADATVLTVRLTPSGQASRISGWVRYHRGSAEPEVPNGLNRLTGRQIDAVRASMPAPAPEPILRVPARVFGRGEQIVMSRP